MVPSRVEVRKVEYSLEDLLAVATDIEELRSTDLPEVTSIAISARENAVMVGVHEEGVTTTTNPRTSDGFLKKSKDKTRDKVLNEGRSQKATSADLDEMIEIEVGPVAVSAGCYGRLNCGTTSTENWRGGTGLDTDQSGNWSSSNCTTGFIFTNGAQRLLSTNGHCDIYANRDVAIAGQSHTGGSLDKFTMNTVMTDWPLANATDFNAEVDSDAAMILIHPNRSDNRIYKSYQNKNWYINDRNDNLMEDDVTCVSGAWLGWRCGKVRPLPIPAAVAETSFAEPFDDLSYDVDDYVKFNVVYPGVISTIAGNSGSPMIQGRKAHGLLFGEISLTLLPGNSSTSIEAVFTPTSSIENELGVELCEAAADC